MKPLRITAFNFWGGQILSAFAMIAVTVFAVVGAGVALTRCVVSADELGEISFGLRELAIGINAIFWWVFCAHLFKKQIRRAFHEAVLWVEIGDQLNVRSLFHMEEYAWSEVECLQFVKDPYIYQVNVLGIQLKTSKLIRVQLSYKQKARFREIIAATPSLSAVFLR